MDNEKIYRKCLAFAKLSGIKDSRYHTDNRRIIGYLKERNEDCSFNLKSKECRIYKTFANYSCTICLYFRKNKTAAKIIKGCLKTGFWTEEYE